MENKKFIPVRALSAPSGDSASDGRGGGNTDLEKDPDTIRDDIPDYGQGGGEGGGGGEYGQGGGEGGGGGEYGQGGGEGGYSGREANTTPDNPDADARYWPVDNPTNPDNVVPYRGEVQDQFGNKDNRAAVVDPYGRTYPAENQDKYGNPDYGTTGGWNSDFSGQGNNGGGYSDFCCTGAT